MDSSSRVRLGLMMILLVVIRVVIYAVSQVGAEHSRGQLLFVTVVIGIITVGAMEHGAIHVVRQAITPGIAREVLGLVSGQVIRGKRLSHPERQNQLVL